MKTYGQIVRKSKHAYEAQLWTDFENGPAQLDYTFCVTNLGARFAIFNLKRKFRFIEEHDLPKVVYTERHVA